MSKRNTKAETIVWKDDGNPILGYLRFSDILDMVKETKSKKVEIEMTDDGIRIKADGFEIGTF